MKSEDNHNKEIQKMDAPDSTETASSSEAVDGAVDAPEPGQPLQQSDVEEAAEVRSNDDIHQEHNCDVQQQMLLDHPLLPGKAEQELDSNRTTESPDADDQMVEEADQLQQPSDPEQARKDEVASLLQIVLPMKKLATNVLDKVGKDSSNSKAQDDVQPSSRGICENKQEGSKEAKEECGRPIKIGIEMESNISTPTTSSIDSCVPTEKKMSSEEKPPVDPNEKWELMFQKLLQFKDQTGHCLVPNRYKADVELGVWVSQQRKDYKAVQSGCDKSTPMTTERAKRLMDVGFEWTAMNPRHLQWDVRFKELKDFKKEYGHAQVPIAWEHNNQLANWVSTQRQEYKNLIRGRTSRLNERRVKLLDSIGFAWELQRGGRRRRLAINEAADYKEKPPHPADMAELDPDEIQAAKVDQSYSEPPPPGCRKPTILKAKSTKKAKSAGKRILPGVTIIAGGAENARRAFEVRTSQEQQEAEQEATSREALKRALGNQGGVPSNSSGRHESPWQMLPNGSYQHKAQKDDQSQPGSPYFPMAAPFAAQRRTPKGEAPLGASRHPNGQDSGTAAAPNLEISGAPQQWKQPAIELSDDSDDDVPEIDDDDEDEVEVVGVARKICYNPWQQQALSNNMTAEFQTDMANILMSQDPNVAAAAAAAQHLQAAMALTAGIDESKIPPSLAPLASVAKRFGSRFSWQMPQDVMGSQFGGQIVPTNGQLQHFTSPQISGKQGGNSMMSPQGITGGSRTTSMINSPPGGVIQMNGQRSGGAVMPLNGQQGEMMQMNMMQFPMQQMPGVPFPMQEFQPRMGTPFFQQNQPARRADPPQDPPTGSESSDDEEERRARTRKRLKSPRQRQPPPTGVYSGPVVRAGKRKQSCGGGSAMRKNVRPMPPAASAGGSHGFDPFVAAGWTYPMQQRQSLSAPGGGLRVNKDIFDDAEESS